MIQIQFKFKSFDSYYLDAAIKFIDSVQKFFETEKTSQISVSSYRVFQYPSRVKKITVVRSPHIDKSSREQFQIQTHKRVVEIHVVDQEIAILLMKIFKNTEFIGTQVEISLKFLDYFYEK